MKWLPIDTVPHDVVVLVYEPPTPDFPDGNIGFDIYTDDCWLRHAEHYDHFCVVACDGMIGPSEDPKYTHWLPLPPLPHEEDTTNAI